MSTSTNWSSWKIFGVGFLTSILTETTWLGLIMGGVIDPVFVSGLVLAPFILVKLVAATMILWGLALVMRDGMRGLWRLVRGKQS